MSKKTNDTSELNLNTLTLPADHPLNKPPWTDKKGGGNEFMIDFLTDDGKYLICVEKLDHNQHFNTGSYCHVGLYKKTGDGIHDFKEPSFKEVDSNEDLRDALRELAEYANTHLIPEDEE